MNRGEYFNYIENKLGFLSFRIKNRGRINLLDLNIHSESFFAELINNIFKYKLKNLNAITQNAEGIDLKDEDNKIVAQVSSTCTKQKIEGTLDKGIFRKYAGYRFKFIAISGEADKLRSVEFKNPHNMTFDPRNDIYDIKSLLNAILYMPINDQRTLYELVEAELGNDVDIVKVDSNLATIINILSAEDLSSAPIPPEINSFEIDRKVSFNNLIDVKFAIDEYKVFYNTLDEKYREFDKQGVNKSLSVFSALKNQYHKLRRKGMDPSDLFYSIIENTIELIKNSKNYIRIPSEELEICVFILVVDAFIRCKIFENPGRYNHVIT